LVVVATHVETPVVHEVTPVLHEFGIVQARPAVHELQAPLLQTWLVPQLVPFMMLLDDTQVCWPVPHDVTPFWHTL
jgi:hypothetical protein